MTRADLDASAIARRLGAAAGPVSVVALTSSTNDDARAAAAAGAPHGAAFLADAQTHGRGRGGHAWHSPAGENLYLSLVARPRVPAASIAPVTLAAGVAVARALEVHAPGAALRIKWPNDVVTAERKKLAGVLVEGQLRGAEVVSLVVGVGVNVHAASFPGEIADRATSLALLGGRELDRSAIAATVLAALLDALASYELRRLADFSGELARRDALFGGSVVVSGIEGTAAGIDGEGRLLIRAEGGRVTAVASGAVERW